MTEEVIGEGPPSGATSTLPGSIVPDQAHESAQIAFSPGRVVSCAHNVLKICSNFLLPTAPDTIAWTWNGGCPNVVFCVKNTYAFGAVAVR